MTRSAEHSLGSPFNPANANASFSRSISSAEITDFGFKTHGWQPSRPWTLATDSRARHDPESYPSKVDNRLKSDRDR